MRLLVLLAVLVAGYFLTRMLYHHVMMDKILNRTLRGCKCGCLNECKCPVGCGCGCRNRIMGDHMGGTCHECM